MASKPRKPRPRPKAKPRRPAAASARKPGRGRKRAPKANRTAGARKTARKPALRRKKTGAGKRVSRARRPARKRAPATPARAAAPARRRKVPIGLLRERRTLREEPPPDDRREEEHRYSGAARTGKSELFEKLIEHTETGPVLTGGDLDGNWESAYSSGDEAPGGDNPTPDQGGVDDNAKALGIHYDDNEELRLGDKEAERDRHRWELDPASAEDYQTRDEE